MRFVLALLVGDETHSDGLRISHFRAVASLSYASDAKATPPLSFFAAHKTQDRALERNRATRNSFASILEGN